MAAILAGGITMLVFRRLRAGMSQRPVTQIVVAASELPPGMTLTAKDVIMLDWPSDVPLAGAFTKADQVVGHPLIHSLGAKEPVLQRDLGVEGSGIGLSAKIPPGMRATAVRSNEIVGVAGFLYPGSHVDVLATYNIPGGSGSLTQTVLQDVEVLAAGQTIEPDPQGKPQEVNVVTLLLSPEDSQRLQLSSTQGSIQFVLRNGTDSKSVDLHATRIDQLDLTAKPAAPSPKRTSVARATGPTHATYVLEVIQGTQRSVHKFEDGKAPQGEK